MAVITGTAGNDTITTSIVSPGVTGGFATDRADTIDGGNGNDAIDGGGGNDNIRGGNGNDTIKGGNGNDTIRGGLGDDNIDGGKGNDTIRGGTGNDSLSGGDGNDLLFGFAGSDTLDGSTGIDTVDYSELNSGITLGATGIVTKASGGIDRLIKVETIIADAGFASSNTFDASGATGSGRIDVNLSANSAVVETGVTTPGNLAFTVQNFNNVNGTVNNDTIIGNAAANIINGNSGNDTLNGGDGKDTLGGGGLTANEKDTLTGGAAQDIFALGDFNNLYYNGDGNNGYALITDFSSIDLIRIKGSTNYSVTSGNFGFGTAANDTQIFFGGDLIAIVQDVTIASVTAADFQFV
jgi:Ca2+-binding RTX toxin-like protein